MLMSCPRNAKNILNIGVLILLVYIIKLTLSYHMQKLMSYCTSYEANIWFDPRMLKSFNLSNGRGPENLLCNRQG